MTEKNDFRDYENTTRDTVKEFYRQNHLQQTVDFVKAQHEKFLPPNRLQLGIWATLEKLNAFVDDSDPDTDVSQVMHALQSAEAARADNQPRWMILTALIHDLGKMLCIYGEPQWAVVGDTYPVGCAFSDKIVFHEFFDGNPDSQNSAYQTDEGIYEKHCGLDNVLMSWGHDEYLYHVVKDYLPTEGAYIIRYHSFYPCHRDKAYENLMNEHDHEMMKWVKIFNPYDLYSKADAPPNVEALKPYYQTLINEFFPEKIAW